MVRSRRRCIEDDVEAAGIGQNVIDAIGGNRNALGLSAGKPRRTKAATNQRGTFEPR